MISVYEHSDKILGSVSEGTSQNGGVSSLPRTPWSRIIGHQSLATVLQALTDASFKMSVQMWLLEIF